MKLRRELPRGQRGTPREALNVLALGTMALHNSVLITVPEKTTRLQTPRLL